jgi:hypothetical protein
MPPSEQAKAQGSSEACPAPTAKPEEIPQEIDQPDVASAEIIQLNPRQNPGNSASISSQDNVALAEPHLVIAALTPAAPLQADLQGHDGAWAKGRIQIAPSLLENYTIGGVAAAMPHLIRVAVSTALQTETKEPICILLPSTENVAQIVAIISSLQCLAADYPENRERFAERYLKQGSSVRILPDGNVFAVGERTSVRGIDGVYLGFTEKETLDGDGKRLVPDNELLRYEPTTRQLPKSRASIRYRPSQSTSVDALAGVRAFGNSGLYSNRIVLVGSRAEFERVLESTTLASSNAATGESRLLAEDFAWGTFDENGRPFVLSPDGSAGCPLVAVARIRQGRSDRPVRHDAGRGAKDKRGTLPAPVVEPKRSASAERRHMQTHSRLSAARLRPGHHSIHRRVGHGAAHKIAD